jgi:hypothetical protein
MTCTASVAASEKYENKGNAASEWGTNVHYLGEQLLKNKNIKVGGTLKEGDRVSFVVDKEMLSCAEEYADYVRSYFTKTSIILIEEQFNLSSISVNQFGTSDATVLNDTHLHIFDLKTGHNIVDADNNSQLMLYAIGAIDELEMIYDIEKITLHIVQTRANHISSWELSYDELMMFKKLAQDKAAEILSGETSFTPSIKGCKWCSHQANCDALRVHVESVVSGDFDNLDEIDGMANIISTSHIKNILDNVDLITNFVKAVQEVALERLENGIAIDGYKLVESRTNRKWIDEEEVEKYLTELNDGIDYFEPPRLKAMGKILKILPKDKKLQELLTKPEGRPVLAPLSDKRSPIGTKCDMFDNLD